jgi:hypothetical protein
MSRILSFAAFVLGGVVGFAGMAAGEELAQASQGSEIQWHDDYTQATRHAMSAQKMLFIFFHDPRPNSARTAFETRSLTPEVLQTFAERYVWAKVPTDATITIDGCSTKVLSHAAFREMQGRQGLAIVDYQSNDRELRGRVVSAFPFKGNRYKSARSLAVILDLPPGTITQRTMVYAVRTHPEAPASAVGLMSRTLAVEAQSHSHHQASIGVQGHHNWDSRFQRINGKLRGLTAREVVAESWPNEDLVEACVDCVHSWRQSPGHWSAVQGRHRMFGYDIKRGLNGIWYATGIFAR